MPQKSKTTGRTQNRATNIGTNGLTADEAMRAVLTIPKEDAARIIGKKPGKKSSMKLACGASFNRVHVAGFAQRDPFQQIHPSLRRFHPAYNILTNIRFHGQTPLGQIRRFPHRADLSSNHFLPGAVKGFPHAP